MSASDTLPLAPERFRIIIEGNSTQCLSRANISPGELGRQMEKLLTGQLASDCRGWSLSITVEDPDDMDQGEEPVEGLGRFVRDA